jgi:hypothetical protein
MPFAALHRIEILKVIQADTVTEQVVDVHVLL